MRYLKDIGFVIKRVNFSDSDRFITLFTKHHGKIDVLAKGVRKLTSRRSPHIELLNLVRFQTIKTRKNAILSEVEVVETFSHLKENYSTVAMIFLVCELIDRLCPYHVKHEDVFWLIQKTLENLEKNNLQSSIADFQTRLLTHLGFWDGRKRFETSYDIDRFVEKIAERKIRTKTVFKL